MPNDFDWLVLIDKKAAIKEQFPPLSKVIKERPGSASDNRKQRIVAEDNQLAKVRRDLDRWNESIAKNARRQERLERERRTRIYKGIPAARKEAKETA